MTDGIRGFDAPDPAFFAAQRTKDRSGKESVGKIRKSH